MRRARARARANTRRACASPWARDTPFQVHDIDGKGKCDVFLVKDFKLQILDGMTGKVKKWMWMPEVPADYKDKEKIAKFELKERPHELNAGDSISFFDLSGNWPPWLSIYAMSRAAGA